MKMNMIRYFSDVSKEIVKNSLLAQLRKKTGFSLINCRKALQLHNNNIAKAEEWLKAEAVKLGWEKAMKLSNRVTSEGLIAAIKRENKAVMVEVNCETDFVARNEKFQSLVEDVVSSCIMHPIQQETNGDIKKVLLNEEQLGSLMSSGKEKLSECVAVTIGTLGEKIVLNRAFCCEVNENIELDVSVHPPLTKNKEILFGKYAALVAFKRCPNETKVDADLPKNLGAQLCTHIIGLNPRKIGDRGKDIPREDVDDEDILLNQEFLLNPSITIRELLNQHGVEVLNFQRFVCGGEETEQNIERENTEEHSKI